MVDGVARYSLGLRASAKRSQITVADTAELAYQDCSTTLSPKASMSITLPALADGLLVVLGTDDNGTAENDHRVTFDPGGGNEVIKSFEYDCIGARPPNYTAMYFFNQSELPQGGGTYTITIECDTFFGAAGALALTANGYPLRVLQWGAGSGENIDNTQGWECRFPNPIGLGSLVVQAMGGGTVTANTFDDLTEWFDTGGAGGGGNQYAAAYDIDPTEKQSYRFAPAVNQVRVGATLIEIGFNREDIGISGVMEGYIDEFDGSVTDELWFAMPKHHGGLLVLLTTIDESSDITIGLYNYLQEKLLATRTAPTYQAKSATSSHAAGLYYFTREEVERGNYLTDDDDIRMIDISSSDSDYCVVAIYAIDVGPGNDLEIRQVDTRISDSATSLTNTFGSAIDPGSIVIQAVALGINQTITFDSSLFETWQHGSASFGGNQGGFAYRKDPSISNNFQASWSSACDCAALAIEINVKAEGAYFKIRPRLHALAYKSVDGLA